MLTNLTVGEARQRARRAGLSAYDLTIRRAQPRGFDGHEVAGPFGPEAAADVTAHSMRGIEFMKRLGSPCFGAV